jgi:hypothetical protein
VEVTHHTFLTLALYGGGWLSSYSGFVTERAPQYFQKSTQVENQKHVIITWCVTVYVAGTSIVVTFHFQKWPGSSVGLATGYGLDSPEIKSQWGEIFRTRPDRPWGPPSLLYNGYRVFPGGKSGRGVVLTTHPLQSPRSRMSRAIPLLPLWALRGLL